MDFEQAIEKAKKSGKNLTGFTEALKN